MDVQLHVGPEYSWDVLREFLQGVREELVSAIYEFHGPHIKDAIEDRLRNGASMTLVADNATFAKVREPDEEFERADVFKDWAERFRFKRIVAPEGTNGLIANSYHTKVSVREDNTFWLSSGNWKKGSSQPVITPQQREGATEEDLPGNREWHVVIKNKTLATRFRSHILQDFKRATDLGGLPVPRRLVDESFVDVPLEEEMVLERPPPRRLLAPKTIRRRIKVRPLMTPDQEGAVYSEAVLQLIRSARTSLLFQIPYIGMPPNPREDRGFIDELIRELTRKLKTLEDARVLLRSGGKKFSSPMHAAWYFKSKDVDIERCLRVIEDHHTKGMIVDGKRVLLGSHNWSKDGVTLNRDASLIFDDEEIAGYYATAFEIDWERASPVRPRRFVRPEALVREAVGAAPPPGYRRVRLSEWLGDD
jgi:phosphatidylserine/phosphatidylglycerophosphate/cardiolipin synthase-like enzyme